MDQMPLWFAWWSWLATPICRNQGRPLVRFCGPLWVLSSCSFSSLFFADISEIPAVLQENVFTRTANEYLVTSAAHGWTPHQDYQVFSQAILVVFPAVQKKCPHMLFSFLSWPQEERPHRPRKRHWSSLQAINPFGVLVSTTDLPLLTWSFIWFVWRPCLCKTVLLNTISILLRILCSYKHFKAQFFPLAYSPLPDSDTFVHLFYPYNASYSIANPCYSQPHHCWLATWSSLTHNFCTKWPLPIFLASISCWVNHRL